MNNTTLHPLLDENPDGTKKNEHYDKGEEPAIMTLEKRYSVNEMIAWSKITSDKYRLRYGHKDPVESEENKIDAYTRYLISLIKLKEKAPQLFGEMTVWNAYQKQNIKYRY